MSDKINVEILKVRISGKYIELWLSGLPFEKKREYNEELKESFETNEDQWNFSQKTEYFKNDFLKSNPEIDLEDKITHEGYNYFIGKKAVLHGFSPITSGFLEFEKVRYMIKPEELRIGNFLQDRDGKFCQVIELYANGVFYAPVIGNAITKLPNSPILITDEWLNDLGFSLTEEGWEIIIKNEIRFSACRINGGYSIGLAGPFGLFTVKLKYVHELQNLFFIISGNNELKLQKSKENKSENSASFLFPD